MELARTEVISEPGRPRPRERHRVLPLSRPPYEPAVELR